MRERIERAGQGICLHARRHVVGYLALAVALGGTAYAGGKLGSGNVGGRDLKPAVTRFGDAVTLPPNGSGSATAKCEKGERAIAPLPSGSGGADGGAVIAGIGALGPSVKKDSKRFRPKGYSYNAVNTSSEPQLLSPAVVCLRP